MFRGKFSFFSYSFVKSIKIKADDTYLILEQINSLYVFDFYFNFVLYLYGNLLN